MKIYLESFLLMPDIITYAENMGKLFHLQKNPHQLVIPMVSLF